MIFEEGKRYVFRKSLVGATKGNWANECDGKEVKVIDSVNGEIKCFGMSPCWCEEIVSDTKEEKIIMQYRYVGETTDLLTYGATYEGKHDAKGFFRVRNNKGIWSKYSKVNFTYVDDPIDSKYEEKSSMSDFVPSSDLVDAEDIEPPTKEELELLRKEIEAITLKREEAVKEHEVRKKVAPSTTKTIKEESKPVKKITLRSFLEEQGVPSSMVTDLGAFRKEYDVKEDVLNRIESPSTLYQGGEVWTAAITAILEGQHILLQGPKATGKNVLANCLSFFFGRPQWDISFHVNTDASSLIGAETFKNNEVQFRPGSVYECATYGGFGVLDEVNMAKTEAMAVLHSVTDDRRVIDVPGYDRIKLHPATRFIATMNYGYAGTRELNEAFASRFVIIQVPQLTNPELVKLLAGKFPTANKESLAFYSGVFDDLQSKAKNAEISTKPVDLRGLISALKMTQRGMTPFKAMEVNIINKCFDQYERDIVRDLVKTRIPMSWKTTNVFKEVGDKSLDLDFSGVKY